MIARLFQLQLLATLCSLTVFVYTKPSPFPSPMNDGSSGHRNYDHTPDNNQYLALDSNSSISRPVTRHKPRRDGSHTARAGSNTPQRLGGTMKVPHRNEIQQNHSFIDAVRNVSGRFRRQRSGQYLLENKTHEDERDVEFSYLLEHLDPSNSRWQNSVTDNSALGLHDDGYRARDEVHCNPSNTNSASDNSPISDFTSTPNYYDASPHPSHGHNHAYTNMREDTRTDHMSAYPEWWADRTHQSQFFYDNPSQGQSFYDTPQAEYFGGISRSDQQLGAQMDQLSSFTQGMNLAPSVSSSGKEKMEDTNVDELEEGEIAGSDEGEFVGLDAGEMGEEIWREDESGEPALSPLRKVNPKPRKFRRPQFPNRQKAIRRAPLGMTPKEKAASFSRYFKGLMDEYLEEERKKDGILGRYYIHPWEYQLPFKREIIYKADVLYKTGYETLSDDQLLVVNETVRRVRAYKCSVIQQKLVRSLGFSQAHEILLGTAAARNAAIEELFPTHEMSIDQFKFHPWMTGLSDMNRIKVIDVLADATFEDTDTIHDAMLRQEITPAEAKHILRTSKAEHISFFNRRGLYTPRDKYFADWSKGLSRIQRGALLQRIINTGVQEAWVRRLLLEPYVPEGFGKFLLRTESEKFRQIVSNWRNVDLPVGHHY